MRTQILASVLLSAAPAVVTSQAPLQLSEPIVSDGLFADSDGTLYGAGGVSNNLYAIADDGTVTVVAQQLRGPVEVARGSDDKLYFTEYNSGTVSRINDDGSSTEIAQLPGGASGLIAGPDGSLYASVFGRPNGDGNSIHKISPDGKLENFVVGKGLSAPIGLAFDDLGFLWVANAIDGKVHKVSPAGTVQLVATLPRPKAGPYATGHIAWSGGLLYASGNFSHVVYSVSPEGEVKVVAGNGTNSGDGAIPVPNGLTVSPDGKSLYVISGRGMPNSAVHTIPIGE